MIIQTSPAPYVLYPIRKAATRTARDRSRSGRWAVIEQEGWFIAIDSTLLSDPHVTAGRPYRTLAVYEHGQRVEA